MPWGLFLPWGFWFCRKVFCFCREVFFFQWGFWFCREVFCFFREVFGFAVTVGGHRTNLDDTVIKAMRSSAGCETWLYPTPTATIPQCSWFLNLGGIHVFFAMLKAKDKKNFYWLFICFLLGKTEFCMYNDLIQRTNDSIWIIHEAVVTI